eukprot:CAMPEP_0172499578 /NCGR_PEP_ID=MMETSP1066-20121228/128235_1 /TAXON_ID=671091 /ORGANISM="Coscinodiscus wailesii, Strain CCMP2513" /LENGTH=1565 /DNA_ID=CAMNT_0013273369 /DNA_START=67 /DNA_END=4764 /DNA_ORIENTATION=+
MSESDVSFDDYSESDDDFSLGDENVAPNVMKKGKKGAAAKKPQAKKAPAKKPSKKATKKAKSKGPESESDIEIMDMDEDNDFNDDDSGSNDAPKKTVEQMYQKKTQLEHILLRPDTYIGSVERLSQAMYVLNPETSRIVKRDITYTPGLYKIFDEILVNAADNKQRDPKMDRMEITIDPEANIVSVKNNGKGIPVVVHKEHKCYVPTLIFGHLLTGSNFDDDEKKTTGGRNGYGAKLANIFSTKFIVECVDSSTKQKFRQEFHDNMSVRDEPTIKKLTAKEAKAGDSTKITFSADLQRFKMGSLDDDTVGLMSKRAYDIAGAMANRPGKRLDVYLNGTKLPIKSFKDYLDCYDGLEKPVAYEKMGPRWEVGVGPSDGTFQQISFVNSISTSKGGGHTTYIADQISNHLMTTVKKKYKGTNYKANQIKNHLCVYVNCLVENPSFDSQTKEFLTTRPKSFGSQCELSKKFLKDVDKSIIVENILAYAKFKDTQALKRQGGKKKIKLTGISKLDDANHAGSAKSKDCTLIITEGDSAKSLAMSGLSVVGRDYYGVFPLKGKPLNVRDASQQAVMKNEEIKNIVDILGLKYGVDYDESTIKTLRYGHLMIMADQDHDGSHIKGLVINFIHHFWPSLLNVKGFLQQFITPIVKCTKGKSSKTFFTIPEYETWRESTGNDGKGWSIKYYKGLGTSTSAEAKDYFSNLDLHEIHFQELANDNTTLAKIKAEDVSSSEDMEIEAAAVDDEPIPDMPISGTDQIDMAFAKKRVDDRKTWLNSMSKGTYLNYSQAQNRGVAFTEFINKELILFSQASLLRSIPHIYDGFKPSQRKVLYACFKRKLKGEIKVAQLAGYIGEHAAYHHGEMSLTGTVVGMAQNFCGSNNVNLLTPSGQFGTRRMGGQDSASPRYIFTKLEKITRTIFHPDDDALLNYLNDDGLSIEPEYYMPVVPMVLINGAEGIGTGWSTLVPNYNPRDVIENLRRMIRGEEVEKMLPWYNGFTGEITPKTTIGNQFDVKGILNRIDDTTIHITELPVKTWTQNYKEMLEKFIVGGKTSFGRALEPCITDFKENHTDTTVSFTVTALKETIDKFIEKEKDGLYGKFKLISSLSANNMNLFNEKMRITKYSCAEEILHSFFDARMEYYHKRKDHLLKVMRREERMLTNKARFVLEVCQGELIVTKRKRKELLAELQERGYELFGDDSKKKSNDDSDEEESDNDDSPSDAELGKGYEYLLGMKIWSLTYEKVKKLQEQLAEKQAAVKELEATPPSDIWMRDLDEVDVALNERDVEMENIAKDELKAQSKNKKRNKAKAKKAAKKKKKKDQWDSDLEDSDDDDINSFSSEEVIISKKTSSRRKAAVVSKPKTKVSSPEVDMVSDVPENVTSSSNSNMANEVNSISSRLTRTSITPRKEQKRRSQIQEIDDTGDAAPSTPKGVKRPTPRNGNTDSSASLESFDTGSFDPVSVTPAPKRKKGSSGASKVAAAKKKPAAKTKKSSTAAPKLKNSKKKVVESENEDSDVIEDVVPPPKTTARARTARGAAARAKINYKVDEDSEESEEDMISLEESESESDYE